MPLGVILSNSATSPTVSRSSPSTSFLLSVAFDEQVLGGNQPLRRFGIAALVRMDTGLGESCAQCPTNFVGVRVGLDAEERRRFDGFIVGEHILSDRSCRVVLT